MWQYFLIFWELFINKKNLINGQGLLKVALTEA